MSMLKKPLFWLKIQYTNLWRDAKFFYQDLKFVITIFNDVF
jgi:hypothetical protein